MIPRQPRGHRDRPQVRLRVDPLLAERRLPDLDLELVLPRVEARARSVRPLEHRPEPPVAPREDPLEPRGVAVVHPEVDALGRAPLVVQPALLLAHGVRRVHGAPLERRVRLGHVRRHAHRHGRGAAPVGLPLLAERVLHPLADAPRPLADLHDLADVGLLLRGEADHEVELHLRPAAGEDPLGGLHELRLGDVLVDDVAHPLAAGLGGEGHAGRADALHVVEHVLLEPVRAEGRDAERNLLRHELCRPPSSRAARCTSSPPSTAT